jgi:hypothetical protein
MLLSALVIVGFTYAEPNDEQICQAAATLGVPFSDLK